MKTEPGLLLSLPEFEVAFAMLWETLNISLVVASLNINLT